MLKIKDNVDLKELEKFGFKPKYDEDTGEKVRYICKLIDEDKNQDTIKVEAIKYWNDSCDFFKPQKINPYFKTITLTKGLSFKNDSNFMDKIYDLIQADLVEKV